jgi:hypothetical protein
MNIVTSFTKLLNYNERNVTYASSDYDCKLHFRKILRGFDYCRP